MSESRVTKDATASRDYEALRLSGADLVTSIRAWFANEIKTAPSSGHNLGKHYFGTSTATIGVLATLAKIGGGTQGLSFQLVVGFVLLFVSAITGLILSIPMTRPISGDTDLYTEYVLAIRRIRLHTFVWLILWLTGAILGIRVVL